MGIRVVLAEDNTLLREGIAQLLERADDIELVGTAVDRPTLEALIEAESPDLVVTDIRMPPTGTDEGIQIAADAARRRAPRSAWWCSASTPTRPTRSPCSTAAPRAAPTC